MQIDGKKVQVADTGITFNERQGDRNDEEKMTPKASRESGQTTRNIRIIHCSKHATLL